MENDCGHGKVMEFYSHEIFQQKDNHFRILTIKLKEYKISKLQHVKLMFEFWLSSLHT